MARTKVDPWSRRLPYRSPSSEASEQEYSSGVSYCEEVQDIKQRLRDFLDTVGEGTFATSGELPNAVNPGLYVTDLGTVGLPLSERDGRDIISICRERSCGKETQDNAQDKHKAYEVVAEHIKLRNPNWAKTLQHAVGKATEQLGVIGGHPSIRADLRNLVIYEGGNIEKPSHDAMDEKGIAAKLIIVLPSAYEGGDTVVQIGSQTQTLSASSSKEFDYSYLACYADAKCFVEPVTSGYRLALTYNLIHGSEGIEESRPSSISTDHKAAINSILEDWKANIADCPNFSPVYMLDNDYMKGDIALESLKGADQARCHHLYDASKRHGFCVFLARFEHSTSQSRNPQYSDDDDDDEYDDWDPGAEDDRPDWMLEELFTMEGVLVAEKAEISEHDVIQSDIFKGEVSYHEDYEAWREDAGLDQRVCLVVVPRARLDGFLSKAVSIKMHGWTQSLLGKIRNDEDVLGTKEELLKLCSAASSRPTTLATNLGSLVNVAVQLEMPSLIEQAMDGSKTGLDTDAFQEIARALPSKRIAAWLPALSVGISRIPYLACRLGAIRVFETEYRMAAHLNKKREKSQNVREEAMMVGRCLAQSLTQSPKDGLLFVGERDADALVLRARSHKEPFVLDVMIPICKQVIGNMDFLASIISGLCIETDKDRLSLSTVQRFAAEVIQLLGQEMCNHCASRGNQEPKCSDFQPPEKLSYPAIYRTEYKKPMSPQALTTLLLKCKKLELFESAAQLLLPLEHIAARPGMIDHTNLLLPVLRSLPSEVVEEPTNLQHYQRLFQVVLLSYMRDYLKVKPSKPENWTREKRQSRNSYTSYDNCSCLTCSELDDFLASPVKSEWRYKAAEHKRKHIDRQLYSIDCSTYVDRSQGTPFTLVVTKNNKSYERELRDWQQRCSLAQSSFDSLGHEKLKAMLAERYGETMEEFSATIAGRPDTFTERQPLAPRTETHMNKKRARNDLDGDESSMKRLKRVEVIDLEDT